MIEVRGLTKRYGDKVAVDDLSFGIEPGRVTGFLGPNGAGKTTTMRLILGLDYPDAGTVTVDGKQYRDLAYPMREVGALLDAKAVHGGRSAYNHLLCLAQTNNLPTSPGRRGARPRRAVRRGAQAVQGLLARHEPAARHRRDPARRPARAHVRRAGQRARPGGHPVDPEPDEGPGRRGPHGLRVQPPDVGDGEHRRPPDRDRQGQAHRRLHDGRVHRPLVRCGGAGADPFPGPAGARRGRQGRHRDRRRRRHAAGPRDDRRHGRRHRLRAGHPAARADHAAGLAGRGVHGS